MSLIIHNRNSEKAKIRTGTSKNEKKNRKEIESDKKYMS
jgi:hypothetical protein